MSAEALPISPHRFAEAIKDLPLTTLHLKAAELRNSIAHLDYSNEQLRTFASPPSTSTELPDPVCVEAIQENEEVIKRMTERMDLLKREVEGRGASWLEFLSTEEVVKALGEGRGLEGSAVRNFGDEPPVVGNGEVRGSVQGGGRESNPWTDGTFQTGRISGGEVVMDTVSTSAENSQSVTNGVANGGAAEVNGVSGHVSAVNGVGQGGRIGDAEMQRRMEERMRDALGDDNDDDDGGMHL